MQRSLSPASYLAILIAGCTPHAPNETHAASAIPTSHHEAPSASASSPAPPPPADSSAAIEPLPAAPPEPPREDFGAQKTRVIKAIGARQPKDWGSAIAGVRTRVEAEESLALTFDACGGRGGDDYDDALIATLRRAKIPATLFVTSRWIKDQRDAFADLARDPLFEIENHGTNHRPCSVTGRSAYDIRGTKSVSSAIDEIQGGAAMIEEATGKRPLFYRPGTAFFDDVCLDIVGALGETPLGFRVNGDGGSGFSRRAVRDALLDAPSGSIVLMHMNHPRGSTAEGLSDALPMLIKRGVHFVQLRDAKTK